MLSVDNQTVTQLEFFHGGLGPRQTSKLNPSPFLFLLAFLGNRKKEAKQEFSSVCLCWVTSGTPAYNTVACPLTDKALADNPLQELRMLQAHVG